MYATVATTFWMFVEGAYLISRFTVYAMRASEGPLWLYLTVGWGKLTACCPLLVCCNTCVFFSVAPGLRLLMGHRLGATALISGVLLLVTLHLHMGVMATGRADVVGVGHQRSVPDRRHHRPYPKDAYVQFFGVDEDLVRRYQRRSTLIRH